MSKLRVTPVNIQKAKGTTVVSQPDLVATEEPIEVRLGFGELENRLEKRVAVIMRTPCNDFELALGFLFTEGIIRTHDQILSIKYCTDRGKIEEEGNVVRVELKPEIEVDEKVFDRNFYASSSCGVCGKSSIESLEIHCVFKATKPTKKLAASLVGKLPETLRTEQAIFEHTGGLHSVGLFDLTGKMIIQKEDVGRHNALDKVVGFGLENNLLPFHNHILVFSGRASFELLQKATMAGAHYCVAIGAPSSLALETAQANGICLIGFTKPHSFNCYTYPEYLDFES